VEAVPHSISAQPQSLGMLDNCGSSDHANNFSAALHGWPRNDASISRFCDSTHVLCGNEKDVWRRFRLQVRPTVVLNS